MRLRTDPDPQNGHRTGLRFGVIADIQYADRDVKYDRHFRRAPERLEVAIADFNRAGVDFVVDLGDLIDGDFRSYAPILDVYASLNVPVYRVLGNHDFGVDAQQLDRVPSQLGMKERYYDFSRNGWRFVVLDGNEVSTYAYPPGSPPQRAAERLLERLRLEGRPNAEAWNGGVGADQLRWLRRTLVSAASQREDVIVLSHFPLWPPDDRHRLWNADEVLTELDECAVLRAVLSGHNHAGAYVARKDVHHITFRSMVDTPDDTSYAIVTASDARLVVYGVGRERNLTVEWQ